VRPYNYIAPRLRTPYVAGEARDNDIRISCFFSSERKALTLLQCEEGIVMQNVTVGFIGLGNQGMPIARRIVDAGWKLQVWARRPASLVPFETTPAVLAASPAALANQCDLLGICVVNDDDVRDVLLTQGALAAMRPNTIIAIHATLLPDTVIELDAAAREHGIYLLDAPVSGGARGAEAGTMTVMVGGEAAALDRARPVFESFATTIAHLGPVGAGQMMKLLNNNLAYANLTMGINALELATRLGMDRNSVAGIIKESSGASVGFKILTDDVLFTKIGGPGSNLAKDIHHLVEVAHQRGIRDDKLLAVTGTTVERLARFAQAKTP
jgi:3-hydroxyisobutyrate dehydrogenase